MKKERISVHICSRNRVGELCVLLESLRHQTYQAFDLIIYDDASNEPILNNVLFSRMESIMRFEKHKVKVLRSDIPSGNVCRARNVIIENDKYDNPYICRLDDDVSCDSNYFELLMDGIKVGYDLMSGVTPTSFMPRIKRDIKFAKPLINKIVLNEQGIPISIGDDCGTEFLQNEILPTHHFRSCALYKKELLKEGIKHEYGINFFREEAFFSVRAILKGFKLGVHTGAKAWHHITPSGGCRDKYHLTQQDEMNFRMWVKRQYFLHGDFLSKYDNMLRKEGLLNG